MHAHLPLREAHATNVGVRAHAQLRPPTPVIASTCVLRTRASRQVSSASGPAHQVPDPRAQQQQGGPAVWDYKYTRMSCSSPCSPDDMRCLKVEALFQNVLMYPRLPSRVAAWLPEIDASIEQITETVEAIADRFGAELGFYIIRRQPLILNLDFPTLLERAENVRSMLDLKPIELYAVLRKNPAIFLVDPAVVRARYNAIHKVVHFSRDAVRTMVRKLPVLLNWETVNLERKIENMRQLAYTRVQWQEDFDCITPSLLAFFFRDSTDLTLRMEYLVATRAAPDSTLKDLFKMTNNSFSRKHPNFRAWRMARQQQLWEKQARLERHHQLQQQQWQQWQQQQQQQQQQGAQLQGEQAGYSGSHWDQGASTYQHQHEHASQQQQQQQQQQALYPSQQQLLLQQQQQQRAPQQQNGVPRGRRQAGRD